jgi:hypothetical protein
MITEWNTKTAKRGDEITEEIYENFLNVLPPAFWRGGVFQVGEPHDTRLDQNNNKWRDTYLTFAKQGAQFFYLGENFRGETESNLGISACIAFN